MNIELKEKNNSPDNINEQNIDETLIFLRDENFIENIKRENERKNTKLEELEKKLAEYEQKDNEQLKIQIEQETDKKLTELAFAEWTEYKHKGWQAFQYFSLIVFLNLLLAVVGFFFAFNKASREWLMEFDTLQKIASTVYILFIVLEILGSKYIFNKNKILEGYNWLFQIFTLRKNKKEFLIQSIEKLRISEDQISPTSD